MPLVGLEQVMRQHGVEQLSLHLDIVPFQHRHVELQVLAGLTDLFVCEQRLELLHDLQAVVVIFGQVHKPGLSGFDGKGNPHKFRVVGIEPCGFGIETELF